MGLFGMFGNHDEEEAQAQQPIDPTVENYIKQKYALDQKYKDAQDDAKSGNRNAGIIEGLSTMFSGGKTDGAFYEGLKRRNDQKVAQADAERNALAGQFGQMRQMKDWESKDKSTAAENDPNSMQSQVARSVAMKFGGSKIIPPEKLQTMSAAEINKHLPYMKDAYEADVQAQGRKDSLAAAAEQRKIDQANKDRDYALRERELTQKMTAEKPAEKKADNEVAYRYNSLKNNAQKLRDTIKNKGTFELFGSEGTDMDSAIYQMAVDYAKLVDPESIAREGEVAAAQKYMLPIRNWNGLTMSNDTADKQIENYIKSLDERIAAREAATGRTMAGINREPVTQTVKDGATAYAGELPKVGQVDSGYKYVGGDPSDPKSWKAVQ